MPGASLVAPRCFAERLPCAIVQVLLPHWFPVVEIFDFHRNYQTKDRRQPGNGARYYLQRLFHGQCFLSLARDKLFKA